ncbi:MAG: ACP S-malonyltransferase [Bacillota bacterium]|nr:ACP S-malonyltransferase [Bacillota bacterium]
MAAVSRVAWLFPGQGAQAVGMGFDLWQRWAVARQAFALADRVLGWPLTRLCFEGPQAELDRTERTQPALLAASVAAARVLRELGQQPAAVAGLSLGEYSALVAAGAVELEEALRLVEHRGRYMQEAVPEGAGAMVAVIGLEREPVVRACRQVREAGGLVQPVNFNCPGQVVIGGEREAVERAVAILRGEGARRLVPLHVSAPFHCDLMTPAARRLEPELRALRLRTPSVPVYSNVDARPRRSPAAIRRALIRQVDHPVYWEETLRAMWRDGIRHFVEVGPGTALSGFVRRTLPEARVSHVGEAAEAEELARRMEVGP